MFLGLPSLPLSFEAIRLQLFAALNLPAPPALPTLPELPALPSLRNLLDFIQKIHIGSFSASLNLGPLTLTGGYFADVKELRLNLVLNTSYSKTFDVTMADLQDGLNKALQPLTSNSSFQNLFGNGSLSLPNSNSSGVDFHLIGQVLAQVNLDLTAGIKLADLFPGSTGTFGLNDVFLQVNSLLASAELQVNDATFNLELGPVGSRFTASITHGSLDLTASTTATSSRIYLDALSNPSVKIGSLFVWQAGGALLATLPLDFSYNGFSTASLGRVVLTVGASYDLPTDTFKITKFNIRISSGNPLIGFISDLLNSKNGSFTSTLHLDEANLDGFLNFTDLTLTVSATLSAGGHWSGSVGLSATSAALFKGSSFSGMITPAVAGQAAITGTYTIGSGFVLNIPTTATMVMQIGDAFKVTASGVTLAYDPNGADNQVLAQIQTAMATSALIQGLPTASLTNLQIRKDGFSFDAFTMTSALGSSPGFGQFITTTGAQLKVSDFAVAFGTGSTPLSLKGTVSLSLTGVKLFPNGGFITSSLTSATASFDFSNFDGTSVTGQLSVRLSGLQLQIGDALLLTTGGTDIVLTPGQQVLGTISFATLSSPKFSGLGTLTVQDLVLRQDGFTLGSLTWSSAGAVDVLAGLLHFDSVTVSLSGFQYLNSATQPASVVGTVTFSAQGAVLFPSVSLLNLHLGTLSGSFDFGNGGQMTLTIPNLVIKLGDALEIDLGSVTLNPGQYILATIPGVQLKAGGLFAGLPAITLPTFQLTRSGFNLGSLVFPVTSNVTIGNFLSLSGVAISTTNLAVDRFAPSALSGSISITMSGITLFPGVSGLTSTFTGVRGTFDFGNQGSPGQFSVTVDSSSISLFNEITLTTGSFTFTPGQQTLGTISTAHLAFPSFGSLSLDVNNLVLTQTGFSVSTAQLNLPSIQIGGLLTLTSPRITFNNLGYTFGGSLSGTVGFNAPGASWSLGSAVRASIGSTLGSYDLATNALSLTFNNLAFGIGNFVDISAGSAGFSYFPATGEMDIIASNVSAVMSGGGFSVGVRSASLAMLEHADGTYALQASGTPVLTVPSDLSSVLSLSVPTLSVAYNNTGSAIDTQVSAGVLTAPMKVASGTAASPYLFIGGSASLTIAGFITVSGNFGFSKITDAANDTTKIEIGVVNVTGIGDGSKYGLTDGTLGLVLFRKTSNSASLGYALVASTTGYLNSGGSLSAQSTVTFRRNTTTLAVNELVAAPAVKVPVVFSNSEISQNGTPFSSIGLSDAIIKIGDIVIKGTYASQPPGPGGESITKITNASLEFGQGDNNLLTLTAAQVIYKSYPAGARVGGVTYAGGVQQVIVTDGTIEFGKVVEMFGSFNITRAIGVTNTLTTVAFSNAGFAIMKDGAVMVSIAGSGQFHYGGLDGFQLDNIAVTGFDILPGNQTSSPGSAPASSGSSAPAGGSSLAATAAGAQKPTTITLGPITLTNPSVSLSHFGVVFGTGANAGKIGLTVNVTIGVETASVLTSGGSGVSITDGSDADKFGISGSFDVVVYLDPANDFLPSGVNLGNFTLTVDHMELKFGSFLMVTADNIVFKPDATASQAILSFTSVTATVNAGPLTLSGSARDFQILGDGSFQTGPTFGFRVALGANQDSTSVGLPSWLPLKDLAIGIQWSDFKNDPTKFILTIDAEISSIKGLSAATFTGGVKGLQIDPSLLAKGEFPIIGLSSFNVGVEATLGGVDVKGQLIAGLLKYDQSNNLITSSDPANTPVSRRVFYVALDGKIDIPGVGGLEVRMAFTDFGPLSVYISASIPIILAPEVGLAITDISGGIDFGGTIPSPIILNGNDVDVTASALNLRTVAAQVTPSKSSADQWQSQLENQVTNIVKNAGGAAISFDDMTKNMVIHFGATMYDAYISKESFSLHVDVSIDITGKILVYGQAIYDGMTMDGYFYGDMTKISQGTAKFLFLFDFPGQPERSFQGESVYGYLGFGFVDKDGNALDSPNLMSLFYKPISETFNVQNTQFELSSTPVAGSTPQVMVNGAAVDPSSYTLTVTPASGATPAYTTIIFNTVLAKGAAVSVVYTDSFGTVTDDFTSLGVSYTMLQESASNQPVVVKVNGNTVGADSYTYANNTITFKSAVSANALVSVNYFLAPQLDANGKPVPLPGATAPAPAGYQIVVDGGARADLLGNTFFIELTGQVKLTFFNGGITKVDVVAELKASYIGTLGAAVGELVIDGSGSTTVIYGALKLSTGDAFNSLEKYGITVSAQATFIINTDSVAHDLDLKLPATAQDKTTDTYQLQAGDSGFLYMTHTAKANTTVVVKDNGATLVSGKDYVYDDYNSTVTLKSAITGSHTFTIDYQSYSYLELHISPEANAFELVANGLAAFEVNGTELFRLEGGLLLKISATQFELIAAANLQVGTRANPLLTMKANALVVIGTDPNTGKTGFAALIDAHMGPGSSPYDPGIAGTVEALLGGWQTTGEFMVVINTFGYAFNFDLPQTNPPFPTIYDENGNNMETTRTIQVPQHNPDGSLKYSPTGAQLFQSQTVRSVSIPGGAPKLSGGYYPDGAYFAIRAKVTMLLPGIATEQGLFYMSITPGQFVLNFSGIMTSTLGVSFNAQGALTVKDTGSGFEMWGAIHAQLQAGAGNDPLAQSGIYLGANGVILLNTSSSTQQATLITLADGSNPQTTTNYAINPGSFTFVANGIVTFKSGTTELFRIEGGVIFTFNFDGSQTSLIVTGILRIGPQDAPLLSFNVTALVFFGKVGGSYGFAAMIMANLSLDSIPDVTLKGSFLVATNTFGADVVFDIPTIPGNPFPTILDENGKNIEGSRNVSFVDSDGHTVSETVRTVTIPGGPPQFDGTSGTPEPYLAIRAAGSVNIADSFILEGSFYIVFTPSRFEMIVNAKMDVGPLGSLYAQGALLITSNGIAGYVALSISDPSATSGSGTPASSSSFGDGIGVSFDATFAFEVNTTGQTQKFVLADGSSKTVKEGVLVQVDGTMSLVGIIDMNVSLQISYDTKASQFMINGKASLTLAGLLSLDLKISAVVSPAGLAIAADVSVDTNLFDVIKISGSGKLYLNTGADAVTLQGYSIAGHSLRVHLDSKVTFIELFTINASIEISVGGSFTRNTQLWDGADATIQLGTGQWGFSISGQASFFGLATLDVSGWAQSNGAFGLSFSGSISFGNHFVGFDAGISAYVYFDGGDNFGFGANAYGDIYIIGIQIGLGVGFSYDSSSGHISLTGSVTALGITTSHTWDIGTLEKPKPCYLAMDANGNPISSGSTAPGGVVYLTTGRGDVRIYDRSDSNETYTVTHVATAGDGSETISVLYNGRTAIYNGVRQIGATRAGSGETIYINPNVTSQLKINGGGGDDTYFINGGSSNLINYIDVGDGNNKVYVYTTDSKIRYDLRGGGGNNLFNGGTGDDVIHAGSGNDQIIAGLGNDTIYSGSGTAYILGDNGTISDSSMSSSGTTGGNDTIYATTGTNFVIGGAGNDRIFGGGKNYILGDNGKLNFSGGVITDFSSSDPSVGGDDFISNVGTSKPLIAIAGGGNDTVQGGSGDDVVMGDGGKITFTAGLVSGVDTSSETTGGNDTIDLGDGNNVAFGGAGNDKITVGSGNNYAGGDNGFANFDASGNLTQFSDGGTPGNDILIAGSGNNVLIGGGGDDQLTGGNGNDVLVGDEATATFNNGVLVNIVTINPSDAGSDQIIGGNGKNVIIGGSGSDSITLGIGYSAVLGDNGSASFTSSGTLISIQTTDTGSGAADNISGSGGSNVIFGGDGADTINVNDQSDVILGDNGSANYGSDGVLLSVSSSDPGNAGNNTITTGTGSNVVIGGSGSDRITGGIGDDIILGDQGSVSFNDIGGRSVLSSISSSYTSSGGGDTINAGGGNNIVFGGAGSDTITAGDGSNFLAGDNAQASFNGVGLLTSIQSIAPSDGAGDTISTLDGPTTIIGGAGSDNITTGHGAAVIIGDNGSAVYVSSGSTPASSGKIVFSNNGILTYVTSTDFAIGAADTIDAGDGPNVIVGGTGADNITTGGGNNVVLGDNGNATFIIVGGKRLLSNFTTSDTLASTGGNDTITTGNGNNTILGGMGNDAITTGNGADTILGDNGFVQMDAVGVNFASIGTYSQTSAGGGTTDLGGNDTITTGDGKKIVLGGDGADTIKLGVGSANASDHIVLGDNGTVTYVALGQTGAGNVLSYKTSDTLEVTGGNDTITTGSGNNVILGGMGNDTITTGNGTDTILGDNGSVQLDVQGGNFASIGTYSQTSAGGGTTDLGGDDTITTGDGKKIVLGGDGADTIKLGVGSANASDHIVLGDNGTVTYVALGQVGAGNVLSYKTSDTLEATGGNDTISTGSGNNVILGGMGNDTITTGNGTDTILGDNGSVQLDVQGGNFASIGTYSQTSAGGGTTDLGGDDTITTGDGKKIVLGGDGADTIKLGVGSANASDHIVLGDNGTVTYVALGQVGAGNVLSYKTSDTLEATGGNDTISTGSGNNVILGGMGSDVITTVNGTDTILGDNGYVQMDAQGGNFASIGTYSQASAGGGTTDQGGNDTITTADGNKTILGGDGADTINAGTGLHWVLGDNGSITYVPLGMTGAGQLQDIETSDTTSLTGGDDHITIAGGDSVVFGGVDADTITTGSGNDTILGDNGKLLYDSSSGTALMSDLISTQPDLGGNDVINAGAGNNLVFGGYGSDQITSLGGNDYVAGDNAHSVFTGGALTYFTTISPEIGGDDVIDAGDGNNVILGGFGNDNITTGNGVDFILGDNGNVTFTTSGVITFAFTTDWLLGGDDTIHSGGGNDYIFGGTGNDWIDAGAGDDTVVGDQGSYSLVDALIDYGHPHGITLYESGVNVYDSLGRVIYLPAIEGNDTIYGEDGNDLIYSEGGDDYVDGGNGDDTVYGGTGDDVIHGGYGNDLLLGGPGGDYLDGGPGSNVLYVDLFDYWNGGMSDNTIVGGPFTSTNFQLSFGNQALGFSMYQKLNSSGSAAGATYPVLAPQNNGSGLSDVIMMRASFGVGFEQYSPIQSLNQPQSVFRSSSGLVRWGGAMHAAITTGLYSRAPGLIGIGEFIESQWTELVN